MRAIGVSISFFAQTCGGSPLNYVPYLITGDQYQLELLQSSANYAIASQNPYYAYYGPDTDPKNPGNATYMGRNPRLRLSLNLTILIAAG